MMYRELRTKQPSILIVDDTPTNLDLLADILEDDYRIKVTTHGKTALAIAAGEDRPDLILLDVMMPEMDGYEVCRQLKLLPQTKDIPVIFITGRNEVNAEKMGFSLGAMDFIIKPFDLHVVRARVYNHIHLKIKTELLESMTFLDGLTNIPNRRHFDTFLDAAWRQAQREQNPISLVMVDVDHFKIYNDHYGHRAGNISLQKVADVLVSQLKRPLDFTARYREDKFVLLLPDSDSKAAQHVADRCREQIEALRISNAHSTTKNVLTISLGLSGIIPTQEQHPMILLEQAELMLSQAKTEGGNCIRAFV
jgi:diguanylate cyclase (GGDEF)-like protein